MFRFKKLPLALALSSVGVSAFSADTDSELEKVLVWGTEVSASSVVLDEEVIAVKQADHISDLLRVIPGVDVGGAHSLNQRITLRSMDDKDIRITIDGANQNSYMYHHMGNLQIHADILKSVNIDVGSNSVLSGGLGGAVRFETKSANDLLRDGKRFGGRVQTTYQGNAGNGFAVTGFAQFDDQLDVIAYYNQVNRDNYEVGGGQIKDASGAVVAGTDGKVRGLEGTVDDALIKLGWQVAEQHRIELGYEHYLDEGDYSYRPDMGLATDVAIAISLDSPLVWPTQFGRDTLTLNYDYRGDTTEVKVAVFTNESDLLRDENGWLSSSAVIRGNPASDSAGVIKGEADNSGANVLAESVFGSHSIQYGFETIQYDTHYNARYVSGRAASAGEEQRAWAVYAQDSYDITPALTVTPGVRYDNVDVDATTVSDTFDEWTFALAAEYEINPAVVVAVSTTELFKAPEIAEVFIGAGIRDTANPDIEAETGRNTEFSLAYEDAVLGADVFAAGITVFNTQIESYIYDYAARGFRDNVGDMEIDGVEAYVSYEKNGLTALLSYSTADSELDAFAEYANTDPAQGPNFDGARIDRQQGDTFSASVDYLLSDEWFLHWDALMVDDVAAGPDLDGPSLDNSKDGFAVHNLSVRWQPSTVEGVTVVAGIDNVFDEFYASQSSRTGSSFHPLFGQLYLLDYEPGKNVKITLSYDF